MDVGSAFPTDAEAPEAVEPGEAPLDHPATGAEPRAVSGAAARDGRHDATGPDLVAVQVVIVATVGE